jgi:hypothetical protein
VITLAELEVIEESSMELLDKKQYVERILHMVVGGQEQAEKFFEISKKYKGKLIFSYRNDVKALAAEIRRLNGWPEFITE